MMSLLQREDLFSVFWENSIKAITITVRLEVYGLSQKNYTLG